MPRAVRIEQDRRRAEIERDPTRFFTDELRPGLRTTAGHVALRLGGKGEDWVFCENATAAVNSVLHSLDLQSGDEIVTTSHAYGAVLKSIGLVAGRRKAILRQAQLSPVTESDDQIVESIEGALTDRTKLLIVDHITSATATIFPVRQIAASARSRNVPVLIDGAHAPGQLALDVPSLAADWYTGNAHKWLFAPRGCGLLWTAPERQANTRPSVLSHGADEGYTEAFDWIGTRDPTPWLCFETAARAHDAFGGSRLMAENRKLATFGAQVVSDAVSAHMTAPEKLRGSMVSLILEGCSSHAKAAEAFRRALWERHRITVPVFPFAGRLFLRISAQIYNKPGDYEALASACQALLFR
ncbi:MAG: aminotransferase class V-fold PLP-dependent enzyme [Rhizomicrobium sp.]